MCTRDILKCWIGAHYSSELCRRARLITFVGLYEFQNFADTVMSHDFETVSFGQTNLFSPNG
jgi:hypothetical protein